MKEVEVKIQIDDAEKIIKLLESKGCKFENPLVQEDIVYIPNDVPTVPVAAGVNVLRVRKQPDKTLFTLKQSADKNHLAKVEIEFEISDAEKMLKTFDYLGYKKMAHTTKTRHACHYEQYEICVDHVNELGDFLEIEKMTDADPAKTQEDMIKILQTLGIDTSQRMKVGYDVLYVQKYGQAGV